MDHFGIGTAIKAQTQMYFQSARRSGRTTSLLESLKDGDRIVCGDSREAERLRGLCRERGLAVTVIAVPVDRLVELFNTPPSEGRTLFEHTWVEALYTQEIGRLTAWVDSLQVQASGFGTAHIETRRKAEQLTGKTP